MKRSFIYLFILMLLGSANAAFGQNGEIYGTVTDELGKPFEGVRVVVTDGGILKGGAMTDEDGQYSVKGLQPGNYNVEFTAAEYIRALITDIQITSGGQSKQNRQMKKNTGKELEGVIVKARPPLVSKVEVVNSKILNQSPTRDINDLVSLSTNTYQQRNGAAVSIGGARADGTVYVVDGMQLPSGYNPPPGTVDQVQVISSGMRANYGDATGGIVAITSKGMSDKLRGSVFAQHSVDGYNQNMVNFTLTGPLVSKNENGVKKPVLGFMIGGDYQYDADANPVYIKNPVLKGDVLQRLQNNPLVMVNTTSGSLLQYASQYTSASDFETQKRQLNNQQTTVRLNGKIDYALSNNINITAGGNFTYVKGTSYNRSMSYFSPDGMSPVSGYTGMGYVRFKQSFSTIGGSRKSEDGTDKKEEHPVISNAYYTVQADYQINGSKSEDPNFKNNLFDYAYVGKFNQSRVPVYSYGTDSISGRTAVVLQTLDAVNGITFEPSKLNPVLANYTRSVYDAYGSTGSLISSANIQGNLGLMNGDFPTATLSQQNVGINNVGASMTGYGYSYSNQLGLHADAAFDFKPRKTAHAIQFGLYYEQRQSGSYSANVNLTGSGTNSIWNLMNQLANNRLLGLDKNNPIFIHNGQQYSLDQVNAGSFFLPTDTIIYARRMDNTDPNRVDFDANLRKKLGLGKTDYIDVYSVDPNKLSLNMFTADELLNGGKSFVSYSGYDYTGKKTSGQVNFNDFFTAKDANGNYTRPIAAFHPNYIAGYIMDAFRFKSDMNFNVGIRIDRYDAATKVLKDPYSLYELQTAGNVDGARNIANGGTHPGNIGSGYAVYVNNNASSVPTIVGYRNGDKWYNPYGVEIADPTVLKNDPTFGTGGLDPQPFLTTDGKVKITDPNFDPNKSFTDYKPQVNVSPRFQFDFPINDNKALFYAHYDILVQRPKSYNYATAYDYYFLDQNSGNTIGNPDLKPEKTFDYELGFQQELSRNSALKVYAFYKERKDMIQYRPYLYAWPRTYYTFGNRDVSTTKGFAFKYDYIKGRDARVPIDMTLSYTLQFNEGSGSSATSGAGGLLQNFISAGLPNLRYISPLANDSRHVINLSLNYSYDDGEGPAMGKKGVHPLENLNANLILRARSGEPYTSYSNVFGNNIEGGLNGSRLPWHFGIDFRIDKGFGIKAFGKKMPTADGQKILPKYYVRAFVYFQNIFNIREILQVYPYTGRPDDDGYVTSPTGQQYFNSQLSPTLSDLYSLYVNNPNYYNGPRRANIGVQLSF